MWFSRLAVCRIAALWLALTVSMSAVADERPVVSGLSHGMHGERVRLMIGITPPPAFAAFTLTGPDRLVVDMPPVDWALPEAMDVADLPYLSGLRYGLFRPDRARFVFDLSEPVEVQRIFTEPGVGTEPGRLVIDLSPTTREAFAASAGAPEAARWRGAAPAAPAPKRGDIVVAIDPGHGGVDPGASWGELLEKNVAMAFAEDLAEAVSKRPGMTPYLVRETDEFVPLAERVARAHRAGANVLLSIHADRLAEGSASGISIYKLSEKASDEAASLLAERENRADLLAGADLSGESDSLTSLLVELARRGTNEESGKLASALLEALREDFKLLRTRPIRKANFRVLKAPDIPSLLLEMGFLDHADDRERLQDPEWRRRAAERMVEGVADWTQIASPGFLALR